MDLPRRTVELGVVGVDSGMVLVMDPVHVSLWKPSDDSAPRPAIKWRRGDTNEITVDEGVFLRWLEEGMDRAEIEELREAGFAGGGHYEKCVRLTSWPSMGGQLHFSEDTPSPGLGVVTETGAGDGTFPAYLTYVDLPDGRKILESLTVRFTSPEELLEIMTASGPGG